MIVCKEESPENPLLNWDHEIQPTPKEDIVSNMEYYLKKWYNDGIWKVKFEGTTVTVTLTEIETFPEQECHDNVFGGGFKIAEEKRSLVKQKIVVDYALGYLKVRYGCLGDKVILQLFNDFGCAIGLLEKN